MMDIEHLKVMFERRGYHLQPIQIDDAWGYSCNYFQVFRGETYVGLLSPEELTSWNHPLSVTVWLNTYANKMHHMQCICGEPILQDIQFFTDGREVFRLVSEGPRSTPITVCPKCGQELSKSACEIEDEPPTNVAEE